MRTPSCKESLHLFNKLFKKQIESVIDVGVQVKTQFLIDCFPNCTHFLFEPVVVYHDMIRHNYDSLGIKYRLFECAVADRPGIMFQHLLSSDRSGTITHSQLLEGRYPERFSDGLLSIQETPVITLDEWATNQVIGESYLIKIDVDGIEDKIISGASRVISNASVLVVEAQLTNLAARVTALNGLGLRLFDIVDNGYYFDQLQQVDLVFVSKKIYSEDIDFRPWEKAGKVIWSEWQQFS